MKKEKEAPKKSKKEKIIKLLKERVYDVFERAPIGSVNDVEVAKLAEEIEKL